MQISGSSEALYVTISIVMKISKRNTKLASYMHLLLKIAPNMLNNCLKVQYIGLAIKTDQYNADLR